MSTLRTSTIIYAVAGTLAASAVGYAVWFDHRRRTDPEFRRALKRESRRQAKAARAEQEEHGKRERRVIQELVDEANEEGFPSDAEEKEAYFMQEVGHGEQLCQQTASQKEAALCFYKALQVYPQPEELMNIYDKTVPKPVLDILAEMVAYSNVTKSASTDSSAAGVE